MAYNGSGLYVLTYNFVTEAGSPPIEISKLKTEFDGIATGLSNVICRDGQSTVSANIPFNNKKITALADATAAQDAMNRQASDARFIRLDGSTTITADIPLNGNKITGLGDAAAATDALNRQTGDGRYLLALTVNSQSDDYTAVIGDANDLLVQTGASKTFTIPANASVAYALGTTLSFTTTDSGGVSIAITSDTLRLAGTAISGTLTLAQYGLATAVKITSTLWLITGSGLSQ